VIAFGYGQNPMQKESKGSKSYHHGNLVEALVVVIVCENIGL
jgi:hypothetical protein